MIHDQSDERIRHSTQDHSPSGDSAAEAASGADQQLLRVCSVLAHELRNPLNVIQASADMMNPKSDAELHLQSSLRNQVERMTHLVDDLLDMSRSTSGKFQLRCEPVDLKVIVQSAVQNMSSMLTSHQQSLELLIDDQPCWVNADAYRVSQVLINLLSNASKYSGEGTQVRLEVSRQNALIEIRVIDEGIGIEPDLLPDIFDFFAQSTSRVSLEHREGRLGIGLGLVKSIVEMHDGSVQVRSGGPGCGSEFVVRVPACEPVDRPSNNTNELSMDMQRSYRVLVVDDRRDNEFIVRSLVAKLGEHDVRSAHNGSAAIAALESFVPEIVIMDLGLPDITGLELAREIRKIDACRETFLVALTGYDDNRLRQEASSAGIDLYRLKPVSIDMLKEVFLHPQLMNRELMTG